VVKVFDRGDGTGADWKLLLENLCRAGFGMVDDQLAGEARQALKHLAKWPRQDLDLPAERQNQTKRKPKAAYRGLAVFVIIRSIMRGA
jgi:hypothetical protein